MITINGNTKRGKQLFEKGLRYDGDYLWQIYNKPSIAKQEAWDKCYAEFCNTKDADAFSIISHNTYGFSVSWITPDGMRLETPKNSYLITFPEEYK